MLSRRGFLASSALAASMSRPVAGAAARMYVSLNGTLLTGGKVGWPDFARLAAKIGYGGADFNLAAAMQEGLAPTRALLAELKIKPAVCGLPVAATRGDAVAFQESMKGLDEAAKFAAACPFRFTAFAYPAMFAAAAGCPRMTLVVSPGSQVPKQEQRKMLKDRLTQISEVLAKSKVRLGLEFLGPLVLRAKAPHVFIYRMDEMLEFAKE